MDSIPPRAWWAIGPALVLLVALPCLSALCLWQTVQRRNQGDDALSRSYADATKSFVGMTIASWVLLAAGTWGFAYAKQLLDEIRSH